MDTNFLIRRESTNKLCDYTDYGWIDLSAQKNNLFDPISYDLLVAFITTESGWNLRSHERISVS